MSFSDSRDTPFLNLKAAHLQCGSVMCVHARRLLLRPSG
jgi:hypothetical protein